MMWRAREKGREKNEEKRYAHIKVNYYMKLIKLRTGYMSLTSMEQNFKHWPEGPHKKV